MKNDINFQNAINHLFKLEGGYSNNKYDKGGETNYGIAQKTYSAYLKKQNLQNKTVKTITKEEATKIYYEEYWLLSGANKINDFKLAYLLFDSSVNHGVSTAKKMYKNSQSDFDKFINLRREKYLLIVKNNPTQKNFLKGWLNRLTYIHNL
ncbi:MAG: hypothetical protein IJY61_01025 [Candidatus Gastranaerophilales bacterium]|nr:hypothetical protein [Candidatus Gastranaerophilales bacterium]